MSLIFKTDFQIKEIFELKNFSDFYDKLTKCNLILKGITINFKLFLINLIDLNLIDNKIKNETLRQTLTGLKLFLTLRENFIPEPYNLCQDFKKFISKEFNEKQELDKIIQSIPMMLNNFLNILGELLKLLDLNNFSLIVQFHEINFGFNIKVKIKEFSEELKNKLIKDK